jgi:hypothetical protein
MFIALFVVRARARRMGGGDPPKAHLRLPLGMTGMDARLCIVIPRGADVHEADSLYDASAFA